MAGCDCPFLTKDCSLGTSNSTTAPTPSPGPMSFTFSGRIITTQPSQPIAGATIAVGGTGGTSAQTGSDGSFSVTVGTSTSSATISAPGFLTRTTALAGGQDRSAAIDLISTAGFDLDFFDRLARGK